MRLGAGLDPGRHARQLRGGSHLLGRQGHHAGGEEAPGLTHIPTSCFWRACLCVGGGAGGGGGGWRAKHSCWGCRQLCSARPPAHPPPAHQPTHTPPCALIDQGKPTGAIRASFGHASTLADAEALASFVARYYVEEPPPSPPLAAAADEAAASSGVAAAACVGPRTAAAEKGGEEGGGGWARVGTLGALCIYPIKSCGGFSVQRWPLGESGAWCGWGGWEGSGA